MKQCYKCHKTKKNEEFNKNKATKNGLQTYCRDCQKKLNHKRYLEGKTKQRKKILLYRFEKYCPKCDTIKYKKEFHKKADAKDGLQSSYKECNNKANKKYKRKHYKKKSHEIKHKIPVRIIEDKTHIGSAAYTATYNAAKNETYNKACEVYAKKIFYDEQKPAKSLWGHIKTLFQQL